MVLQFGESSRVMSIVAPIARADVIVGPIARASPVTAVVLYRRRVVWHVLLYMYFLFVSFLFFCAVVYNSPRQRSASGFAVRCSIAVRHMLVFVSIYSIFWRWEGQARGWQFLLGVLVVLLRTRSYVEYDCIPLVEYLVGM